MTQIVGIGGKLASGKDAVSDYLVETHGWKKLGMSDALADALYALNPYILLPTALGWKNRFTAWLARVFRVPPRDVYVRYAWLVDAFGYTEAKTYVESRRLLQVLGTEVGRNMISDSVWTDIMERKVKEAVAEGYPGVIVTGIRFPNELESISDNLGGELWWVIRPSLAAGENSHHASENSVLPSDFDRTILNSGTLQDLYLTVEGLLD